MVGLEAVCARSLLSYTLYLMISYVITHVIKATQTTWNHHDLKNGRQTLGHEFTGYVSAAHPDWAKCASFRRVLKGSQGPKEKSPFERFWKQVMTKVWCNAAFYIGFQWFPMVSCFFGLQGWGHASSRKAAKKMLAALKTGRFKRHGFRSLKVYSDFSDTCDPDHQCCAQTVHILWQTQTFF